MVRTVSIGWSAVLLVLMLASSPTLDHFLNSPDMGYQLSLGRLVLLGQFPFVDMVQHYGPLVALTSAAGQWVHDSVVPEVVICSLGYCLAMTCVFQVVMRGAAARPGWAMWVGLAASLAGWCVLARFYKWYYWCFPMLMLAGLSRVCEDRPRRRRWRLAVGLIAGVGFLYRHDLGGACLLAAIVVIAAQMAARTLGVRDRTRSVPPAASRRSVRQSNWPGWRAESLLPVACWFAVLAARGGSISCWCYLSAMWDGTSGMAEHWRLPLPCWDCATPLRASRAASICCWSWACLTRRQSCQGQPRLAIAGAGRPTRFRCWPRESWG